MSICILLAILVLNTLIVLLRIQNNRTKNTKIYPPGPWGLPVFGHLLFVGRNPLVKYLKWKSIYGPIFSLRFGSIPTAVINDVKVIKEAMSLESFCGRPVLPNFAAVTEFKGIATANGPGHAEQSKFAIKAFQEFGLAKPAIELRIHEEIITVIQNLKCKLNKKHPETRPTKNLKKSLMIRNKLFQIAIVNSIWVAIVGKSFQANDPDVQLLTQLLQNFANTYTSLVSQLSWFFPQLSKILSFIGINEVTNSGKEIYSFVGKEINNSKEDYVFKEPKNFSHAYFDKVATTSDISSSFHKSNADVEQRSSTGDFFVATIDSTVATLDWLLIYMTREPNVQRKLQFEIDSVLQTSDRRFSLLSVKNQMPYTEAVINEILRISSVTPLSIFHSALKDICFHGYDIRKDTLIIPNLYGANHDTEIWEQPQKFIPERFLDSDAVNINNLAENILTFSWGKRACIAEQFARNILFVAITSFFQHFSVSSKDNIPSLDGHFGITYKPHNYELFASERIASY